MWVFIKEQRINYITKEVNESYQVGFYSPDGLFQGAYEYTEQAAAAQKVHFLNGGN